MNNESKRVYTLYRVSTMGQVEKDDIPMQKQACREFAEQNGWTITKEFSEKGVSGFKVSAKDRDEIQEIQKDAMQGKFDILLVFMFDRIGRREDETPFVVEWFVKNGIEVWSAREGQQRFDNHVDKLTNYIRFWQASGESIKTSIRTKTRLAQIVQEGRFRGGVAPYGYRLEKQGRVNKRNHEVNEILIDEAEAIVVRKIFDLYLNRGYGSQRIAHYLDEHGIKTRSGSNFTNATIQNMLKNITYTGVLRSGETYSDIFEDLQIIDPNTFEKTKAMLMMRSNAFQDERKIPLNTKGRTLLSGNVFCGHCGGRLTVTTNGKRYVDGIATPKFRYVCYQKTRHCHLCNGQTGYTARILDGMVEKVIKSVLQQLKNQPKNEIVNTQYAELMEETQSNLARARVDLVDSEKTLSEYEAEVIKVIRGTSEINPDLINKLHADASLKVAECKAVVEKYESELVNAKQRLEELKRGFDKMLSWADMFSRSDLEVKKMIVSNIIETIHVSRGYRMVINLKISREQIDISPEECNSAEYNALEDERLNGILVRVDAVSYAK